MSSTHLGLTHLNIANLRDLARKGLPEFLDSVRGKKGLVLDPLLTGPLSLITDFTLLKDHGVEKIYHLTGDRFETECKDIIYVCRPKLKYMKYITEHIKANDKIGYSIYFVPRRTMVCERVLEDEGVLGDITIGDYAMDWIPFEDDLISMELDTGTWKELYLDGDLTSLYYAARSLMRLQSIYGLFPRIVGKGDCAKQLADMLLRMRREQAVVDDTSTSTSPPSFLNTLSSHIDQLVIIDRAADLVTPLCTQLTYEGLIDEVIGIKHSFVELDSSLVGPGPSAPSAGAAAAAASTAAAAAASTAATPVPVVMPQKKKKQVLNSSDKLFVQLRDLNFAVVGGLLNKIAKKINENYEERHQAKTVAQIRDFVGKLTDLQQEHQSLRIRSCFLSSLFLIPPSLRCTLLIFVYMRRRAR
ncbi:vacuolar protein sorting 33-like protein A [Jimgerdemannia flammicorona]|uniref:Vacuolar protein sorting 33-like protein A n=1 Tax=Jimgerdemannia flammicorona TaxID=994334 RepID=A0A433DHV8_9FUNG|nr:vacuolar protein sorting 33-like protein A [Jimgerdemannia flammicorona]